MMISVCMTFTALLLLADIAPAAQAETSLVQPFFISPRTGQQHVSLDGDWELAHRDAPVAGPDELRQQSKWIRAQVPGSVQWALHRAGELPPPYDHRNAKQYVWVLGETWYYRKTFQVPASTQGQYVFLCFDGIDYYARVWLNGKELGRHAGMFGGPMVEVGTLIRPGASNEVLVEVRAANYDLRDRFKPWAPGKVTLPWGLTGGLGLITGGGGRKWVGGAALPGTVGVEDYFPVGMWRGVRLEIVPRVHLARPFLTTQEAGSTMARLLLNVEVLANTTALDTVLGKQVGRFRNAWTSKRLPSPPALQFQLRDKASSRVVVSRDIPLQLDEGRNWVRQEITVPSPKLWWPNGMGDPNLYIARVALIERDQVIDSLEFDYGIRTIRYLPTAGPRTLDRWMDWQFVVNGRKFFVKGMDWWTADILLDLPRERYQWILRTAQAAGIQLMRTWGAGILETDDFYDLCNQYGILIWQDFPIGNMDTPEWPQDIWEAQVLQNVFRIRNHPSLAIYCGGNEFNPYSVGNTASIGILERSVKDFDGTRPFLRTTPDPGDIHVYPDMDPTWYRHLYSLVPFVSETGPHSVPEARAIREFVDAKELAGPLRNINSQEFMDSHPEFVYHNMEYGTNRTVLLLARASQVDDMRAPSLEEYSVAGQVATAEFIQVVSDILQANYPVTSGLSPWVYDTPWPLSTFCMFVDYDGQPVASYYFLKRTYEPTHVAVNLPHLVWAKGESLPLSLSVMHAPQDGLKGLTATLEVLDNQFRLLWRVERQLDAAPGPSVSRMELGAFPIPDHLEDHFFLLVAELRRAGGKLISRSVNWPRCLKLMADPVFRTQYRAAPQKSLTFQSGPWLRKEMAATGTALDLQLVSRDDEGRDQSRVQVRVRNTGSHPAFYTEVGIEQTRRTFYATDNGFWLAPKEDRLIDLHVQWRDPATRDQATVTCGAWNAAARQVPVFRAPYGKP
jgi:beta-mannosidase